MISHICSVPPCLSGRQDGFSEMPKLNSFSLCILVKYQTFNLAPKAYRLQCVSSPACLSGVSLRLSPRRLVLEPTWASSTFSCPLALYSPGPAHAAPFVQNSSASRPPPVPPFLWLLPSQPGRHCCLEASQAAEQLAPGCAPPVPMAFLHSTGHVVGT